MLIKTALNRIVPDKDLIDRGNRLHHEPGGVPGLMRPTTRCFAYWLATGALQQLTG
jgi:hypothetical protein